MKKLIVTVKSFTELSFHTHRSLTLTYTLTDIRTLQAAKIMHVDRSLQLGDLRLSSFQYHIFLYICDNRALGFIFAFVFVTLMYNVYCYSMLLLLA